MTIWNHTICNYGIDNPATPTKCPFGTIPTCPNPTLGFNSVCPNPRVWKCKACGWIMETVNEPTTCGSTTATPCPNPTGGTFVDICDPDQ